MLKEFTITRSETHYVTYNVYYKVKADTLKEAVDEAEKYWEDRTSKAEYNSDVVAYDKLEFAAYVRGETTYAKDNEGNSYDATEIAKIQESEPPPCTRAALEIYHVVVRPKGLGHWKVEVEAEEDDGTGAADWFECITTNSTAVDKGDKRSLCVECLRANGVDEELYDIDSVQEANE